MIFNWHEHLVTKFLSIKTMWNVLNFGCRTVSLCHFSFWGLFVGGFLNVIQFDKLSLYPHYRQVLLKQLNPKVLAMILELKILN